MPNSVAAYKDVLQTQCYSFRKATFWIRLTKNFAGDGLIVMEFDQHRAHRKVLNSFSISKFRTLEPVLKLKAAEVMELFDQAIAENEDGKTGAVDIIDSISKTTLDIMGIAVLGVDLHSLKNKIDADTEFTFHEAYKIIFAQERLGKALTFINGYIPTRWVPLKANRRFLFATSWLDNCLTDLLRKRCFEIKVAKESGTFKSSGSRDLLTFLAEESMPGGIADGFKESQLVGHVSGLFLCEKKRKKKERKDIVFPITNYIREVY